MTKKQKSALQRIIGAAVLTAALAVLFRFWAVPQFARAVFYLAPYLLVGWDVLRKAIHGITHGQVFDECFLMSIATVGAMLLGEHLEAVAVMLFYQIGELFQSIAVGRSRRSITDLMDIRPDYAYLQAEDGTLERVDPDDVEVGTLIVVRPGEKIPIDGVVEEGSAALNTAALTGESAPRFAEPGDAVISGCVSVDGLLKIRTTREFGESTVSKILDLVENSSMKKARAENFISRFARWYTPIVCFGALALAVIPPLVLLLMGRPAMPLEWIRRALTFLVISCPCAVVVSVPLSFFGGIGCASSRGILVKGSNYLEALADTRYIAFDKTGTLTRGTFTVSEVLPAQGYTEDQVLEYAAAAESVSPHPIAQSIRAAWGKEVRTDAAESVQEIPGHGAVCTLDGKRILAGNARLLQLEGLPAPAAPARPGTVVYVAADGNYVGAILISDTLKPTSAEAMTDLALQGVHTILLTGDTQAAADEAARMLQIGSVRAGLLPEDKVAEVERLLAAKGRREYLAFVGDGINDAPVLSRADVGIAMGSLGSDAAIEAADIVLMDDDPAKISLAMRIAKKTLRIVRENIGFAIGVKVLFLLLGALGISNMWMAIFADVGVMVIAVINAMRALRI
ncbi:MAG: cadmium-translocating P-type ATPase [Lachnospiraceae bacterium]|nr:cadmium-translocating P-type ATPase [Lachnospiraceae bacterium]